MRSAVLYIAGVAIALALMLGAGCGNLTAGYRAITVTVKVGNETGRTGAAVCKVRRLACQDKHSNDLPALQACLAPCHKALTAWTTIVRPAVNSATEGTFAALETAREARKSDVNWIARLKPGLCALVSILQEWSALLGDKAKGLLAMLETVEGIACSK